MSFFSGTQGLYSTVLIQNWKHLPAERKLPRPLAVTAAAKHPFLASGKVSADPPPVSVCKFSSVRGSQTHVTMPAGVLHTGAYVLVHSWLTIQNKHKEDIRASLIAYCFSFKEKNCYHGESRKRRTTQTAWSGTPLLGKAIAATAFQPWRKGVHRVETKNYIVQTRTH